MEGHYYMVINTSVNEQVTLLFVTAYVATPYHMHYRVIFIVKLETLQYSVPSCHPTKAPKLSIGGLYKLATRLLIFIQLVPYEIPTINPTEVPPGVTYI